MTKRKSVLKKILLTAMAMMILGGMAGQGISGNALIDNIFGDEGEVYFKFMTDRPSTIVEAGRFISIDDVKENGEVMAYANRKGFTAFLEYRLPYEILPHPGDYQGELKMLGPGEIRNIDDWDFYPTYEGFIEMMNQFAEDYPSLCQVISVGNSVLGRQLLAARISDNVGMNENEPQFLFSSSIHGDETTGYGLMLRLIDYLLSNYGNIDRITQMVNGIDIWIIPLANPDGTYAGGNNTVNGARRYNNNWIDLNRNFPDPEDGPHPDGEQWQVETMAYMDLAENNHFVSGSNIHGGAEVCNYPWDTWAKLAADDDWWIYVCREYADTVHLYGPAGYLTDLDNGITNGYQWYTIAGGRQDYMNYFHQCREFTLEISNTKLLPPEQLPAFWEYNYRSFLNYIEQSTFGIRGTVKDSVTGWPIESEVYAILHEMDSSWVYSTLPNGNYHRLLYEGTYNIRYSSPGYLPQVRYNVQVINGQATVLNVKLLPEGVGGLENNSVSQAITIRPNPVSGGYARVSAPFIIQHYIISDIHGRIVLEGRSYSRELTLELDRLESGSYLVRFKTDQGLGAKRLVVIR